MRHPIFHWQSLRTRVTLITLVVFLTGIWSLALYSNQLLRQDMERRLGEQQLSNASFIAAGINNDLTERLRALEIMAATISPAVMENAKALQALLDNRPVFQGLFNGGVFATGLDGLATASLTRSSERAGINYRDRDYIAAALDEGETTVGQPMIDQRTLAPGFGMAAPIRDAQGKVIGALAGITNLSAPNFLDTIEKGNYGKGGTYVLAAPLHHLVVTASDKSRSMGELPVLGSAPLHDKFAQGYDGYGIQVNFRGEEQLVAAKNIPVAGWFLGIELPTAEAFAPMHAMRQRLLLAAMLLTLVASTLIFWRLGRQLSPMLDAVKTLASLTQVDQPLKPLPITRQDEVGELIGGFNRLIETLMRREEALKTSEARFRCLTEMSSDCYWESDAGHRFTQYTAGKDLPSDLILQSARLIGLEQWEMPTVLPTPEGWRMHRKVLDAHLPFRNFEITRIGSNGALRHISTSGDPVFDAAGQFTGYQGIGVNISERKQAEEVTKTQQTQIKLAAQVFAQGREGIAIADSRGRIVMANSAFTAIRGCSEAEVLGKKLHVFISVRHSPGFYKTLWRTVRAKNHWEGEIWGNHMGGKEFPSWVVISPVRSPEGDITHYVGTFNDLSNTKAAESRIQWLSHFDALTGLANRELLQDRTAHAISMMQRVNQPLSLMRVSMDHFRSVTDTLGHQAGDELLVEVARRLGQTVREQDTVARLAGKEFALVLPGTPAGGAMQLAAELLRILAQPYRVRGRELTLTASIGIASFPDTAADTDTLLMGSEIAMHRAQLNGRNTCEAYTHEMYQQMLERDRISVALQQAVALDQLQLVYQPLVDLQTGQISGLEALLRWTHPDLGAISPAHFIPLAEKSGLIYGIGEWVMRRACRDIRDWTTKGINVPHVAVNMSPLQFRDAGLIRKIQAALADHQVDPALIYVEVTEGVVMDDVARSEAMLGELKALGIRLSLDDFGTGYSSLSYLKRFPFDKVKIDQSFVRDITTNSNDAVLVKVIVSMAHGLGLKVIAEGVETEAQCEIMRTSGCDEIQGYFFSKPVDTQAIEALLDEGRHLPPHLLRLQTPHRTLLLVDDEPAILSSLKRLFRQDGYVILTAGSGPEGLALLAEHRVDIIISDQRMPGMSGVDFMRAAKTNYPDTIRIVLSGYSELQSITDAINEGLVYRFFTKPWDDEPLREQVGKAFAYKEVMNENRQLDMKIRTTNQELVAANRQLGSVLQDTNHQIAREVLEHVPMPVIGLDTEGSMAFVNAAAQDLFAHSGPLLGAELAFALPGVNRAISLAVEGVPTGLRIDDTHYLVQWNNMGATTQSRGKLVTLTPVELPRMTHEHA